MDQLNARPARKAAERATQEELTAARREAAKLKAGAVQAEQMPPSPVMCAIRGR